MLPTQYIAVRFGVKTLYLVAVFAGLGGAVAAAEPRPVVVELFTSQSCSSCPPAEALLGELAERPGIVALEFHVDYWNDLVHGFAGRWVDPYSRRAHTERQRSYAKRLGGGVYTPQMVVDGRAEVVGSRRRDVERALAAAGARSDTGAEIVVTAGAADLVIRLSGPAPAQPVPVWLARYRARATIRVPAGENRGKTLTNHHIVTGLERLGAWAGGAAAFPAPLPASGDGCAVLVQADGLGPMIGAALCP